MVATSADSAQAVRPPSHGAIPSGPSTIASILPRNGGGTVSRKLFIRGRSKGRTPLLDILHSPESEEKEPDNRKLPLLRSLEKKVADMLPMITETHISQVALPESNQNALYFGAVHLNEGFLFAIKEAINNRDIGAVSKILFKAYYDWEANVPALLNQRDDEGLTILEIAVRSFTDLRIAEEICRYGGTKEVSNAYHWLENDDHKTGVPRFMRAPELRDFLYHLQQKLLIRPVDESRLRQRVYA